MKKKVLSLLLAAALVLPVMSMSVNAATIDQDSASKSEETTITTEIQPTYSVTIPEDTEIPFNETETDFNRVELKSAQLEVGKSVKVSVQTGALANTDDETKTIPYTVMAGEAKFTGAEYTTAGQGTDLTLVVDQDDWDSAYAGTYEGTVTFTISYGDIANP